MFPIAVNIKHVTDILKPAVAVATIEPTHFGAGLPTEEGCYAPWATSLAMEGCRQVIMSKGPTARQLEK